MDKIVKTQAIQPIYKSIRLRKLKSGEKYTDGLRVVDNMDVGVVFPFERTKEGIAAGVQSILGNSYQRKVFQYWIPKLFKMKELMFERKIVKSINKPFNPTTILKDFKSKKTTYYHKIARNTIYDFSSILSNLVPNFNEVKEWNTSLAFKNIDNFIVEWLKFVLINPINKETVSFLTNIFLYGEGVKKDFKYSLIGIKIKIDQTSVLRYLNPAVNIPRNIKTNLDDYIPLMILRSLVAGKIGDHISDPTCSKIYALLKDTSIVFYNDRGYSFLYNTFEDDNVSKMSGNQLLMRIKTLFGNIISTNNSDIELEEEIDEEEKQASTKPYAVEKSVKSDDVGKVIEIIKSGDGKEISNLIKSVKKNENKNKFIKFDDTADIVEEEEDEEDTIPDEFNIDDLDNEIDSLEDNPEEEETNQDEEIKKIVTNININVKPKFTEAQERRLAIAREKYKSIVVDGRTIDEILNDLKTKVIDKKVPVNTVNNDKSTNGSLLMDFEKSYIENTLEHDILSVIKSFSENKSINMHIVDVVKTDTSDQMTSKYTYDLKFIDDRQKNHIIKIDIPKIDEDGFLLISGNRKMLKKQLIFLPVVKCKSYEVMVSSNYNKCFIYREGTTLTRGLSSISKLINSDILMNNSKFKLFNGDSSKNNKKYVTNIEFDVIANKYYKFIIGGPETRNSSVYVFNQDDLREMIKKLFPDYKFKNTILPIGINYRTNKVIEYDLASDGGKGICQQIFDDLKYFNVVPNLDDKLLSMNISKRRMYSRIMVQSRKFPLVSFLGGLFGLSKIINTEKMKVQFSEKRIDKDSRLFIKFNNGYLYYNDENIGTSLILNGLAYMDTENYNFEDFDTERPYIDFFFNSVKSRNVYKGHTAFRDLFIDPITKEILIDLNLPTDFLELFLYANSLLSDNSYKPETSLENYRIRGYENISTILYKLISSQYRLYKQSDVGIGRISIQQDAVFSGLHKSFILENYDATNPVNELKDKSIVTFKGPGGVNSDRVFTLDKRSYDYSAIGVLAISSPDGGSVGITKQLTLNPNITSTRGYIISNKSSEDIDKLKLGNLASPEELDVPFLNFNDDPKRISIASTQTQHIIKINNSTPYVVSTGMDKSVPYLVGNTYVPKAKKDGIIEKVDLVNKFIIVKYNDDTKENIKLGLDMQRNSSFYFGNNIIPNVVVGQTVKKGDIIAYEKDFFKKDILGNIRSCQGVLAKMVLHEKSTTDDDSLCITQSLAEKMGTSVIMRKQISLPKKINLIRYNKIGDHVFKYDPLMVFEESEDDYTAELLSNLGDVDDSVLAAAKQMPKANSTGEIVDMKVYFSVPLEELSESLFDFVKEWSKTVNKKIKLNKENGVSTDNLEIQLKPTKPAQTGSTSRINGAIIPDEGGVLVEYFISHNTPMSVGDKSTSNANLKNIVAQVIPRGQEPITEDGIVLDGCISILSVMARMCYSIFQNGVISHALVEKSKSIAKEYLKSL